MPEIITYSLSQFKEHLANNQLYHCALTVNGVKMTIYANSVGIFNVVVGEKSEIATEALALLPMPQALEQKIIAGEHPLIISGTPFQLNVWNAIRAIPCGTTITYTELAVRCGNKKAVRAAASAAGRNLIAYFIPCHRVIGKNGHLHGYKWGIEAKRLLLEEEIKTICRLHIGLA